MYIAKLRVEHSADFIAPVGPVSAGADTVSKRNENIILHH